MDRAVTKRFTGEFRLMTPQSVLNNHQRPVARILKGFIIILILEYKLLAQRRVKTVRSGDCECCRLSLIVG